MLLGIDVSLHNGLQDWFKRIAEGVRFAAVRLSHGTSVDPRAAAHLDGAHEAGVPVLIGYHYDTDAPASAQAEVFLTAAAEHEARLGVDLGLAVDLEDLPGHPPWPREPYEAVAREMCRLVRAAKRRPCGVYLSPDFARQLDLSWWFSECPLWLARWAPAPGTPPKPWGSVTLWQNRVDSVDHDVFSGSVEDLRAAFGLGGLKMPLEALGRVVELGDATLPRNPLLAASAAREGLP